MEQDRNASGKKASMVAIGSNCLLTALNIVVGLFGGSYALVAEGIHTFTDIVTSVIAYFGFKISQRPADEQFQGGYGRAEAISGLVIVLFLTFISYGIMDQAYHRLQNPGSIPIPDHYVLIMAAVGIFFNYFVSRYIINIGKKINSPAIEADGHHQKTDVYTSIAILIGVFVAKMGFPVLDPIIGFIIGLLILKTAFNIGKINILSIMGYVPENEELISKISNIVENTPDACDAHNIRFDNFASYLMVSLHVHIDADMPVGEAYEITSRVEQNILELPEIRFVSVVACPINENHD